MTTKRDILSTIRDKCIDCCCGSLGEVKKCSAQTCHLWPFRMGKDPNPSRGWGTGKSRILTEDFAEE